MKKTLLFIHARPCYDFAPFVTLIDSLQDLYHIKVISYENETEWENLRLQYVGKDVEFLNHTFFNNRNDLKSRFIRKLKKVTHYPSSFFRESKRLLRDTKYDLLWVLHEETAFVFREELKNKQYILSLYELNDDRMNFLQAIKPVIQKAKEVLIPEYNRACITRVWSQLNYTPTVIPNKPLNHPRQRNIPNPFSEQLKGKKIILYQGFIQRSRNIDKLCEACKSLPDYTIVLMGKGDEDYIQELKSNYPLILHISFIVPPDHLYVTSWAHIAIVKYDFVVLNAIFCAPNKTWEYTGFGIPVLGHYIPGLQYTIGQYKAGVCTNMDDADCIKEAICEIESNYAFYSHNANMYFESCNIRELLLAVAERNVAD